MAIRLIEMHRILKDTGSLYLHCDPTMSHYLKIVLDCVFGEENFRNKIVWERSKSGKTTSNKFASDTDVVLFYSISKKNTFNFVYKPLANSTISQYIKDDNDGRGKYRTHPMQKTDSPGPETTYDYIDNNGRVWKCPAKGWRMRQSKIKVLENDGRLYFKGKNVREYQYKFLRRSEQLYECFYHFQNCMLARILLFRLYNMDVLLLWMNIFHICFFYSLLNW